MTQTRPRAASAVTHRVAGAGLGLRRALMGAIESMYPDARNGIGFLEIAPENWLGIGGAAARQLRQLTERFPFVSHGLSLSIGSPDPLDEDFVRRIKRFLDAHGIADYTEHLSFCSADGHLYDLMPIPFTTAAVGYIAERVQRVQDILGRRIALENASYYTPLATEMGEAEFICEVIAQADCDLLLDVNNIVVNSHNHGYDAKKFLEALPLERVRYLHIAGHDAEVPDLRIDTHGTPVDDESWRLLAAVTARLGAVPTLLERDFDIPPIATLLDELAHIRSVQRDNSLRAMAA
jgi:uncharacterized protein